MIKTKLVYSFRVFEGMFNNRAININLNCLKYYKEKFDEVLFVFLCDNIENDTEEIQKLSNILFSLNFKNIQIILKTTDEFYESRVFKEYIVDDIENLSNELVFFAHSKGVSNYQFWDKDNIDIWICGLYYLSLFKIDDMKRKLIGDPGRFFYGPFLSYSKDHQPDGTESKNGHSFYPGTFYWINCGGINSVLKDGISELPNFYDRWYAERFPSNFGSVKDGTLEGYGTLYRFYDFNDAGMYTDAEYILDYYLRGEEKDKFNEFKIKMLEGV